MTYMRFVNIFENDFKASYAGMMKLPHGVLPGVFTAYTYYLELLRRIRKVPASKIMESRIRVPDSLKMLLLLKTKLRFGFR